MPMPSASVCVITSTGQLCYTMCTVTCYKDELGANYSRIAPLFPSEIGQGGLVHLSQCTLPHAPGTPVPRAVTLPPAPCCPP